MDKKYHPEADVATERGHVGDFGRDFPPDAPAPSPGADLPQYRCRQQVKALKIKSIIRSTLQTDGQTDVDATLVFENSRFPDIEVDEDFLRRCKPEASGYYVRYADGYESFSRAEAFEDGYTLVT